MISLVILPPSRLYWIGKVDFEFTNNLVNPNHNPDADPVYFRPDFFELAFGVPNVTQNNMLSCHPAGVTIRPIFNFIQRSQMNIMGYSGTFWIYIAEIQ